MKNGHKQRQNRYVKIKYRCAAKGEIYNFRGAGGGIGFWRDILY